MRRLLVAAIAWVLATVAQAQEDKFWGPGINMPIPAGYQVVDNGLGWGYAVDLVPASGKGEILSLVRVIMVPTERGANEVVQEYWGLESPQLGQAGWQLTGTSTEIKRTFLASGEEEDKDCTGQLIKLAQSADAAQTAQMQLFAWKEANGCVGICRTFARTEEKIAAVNEVLDQLSTFGITATSERKVEVEGLSLSIPVAAAFQTQETESGDTYAGVVTGVGSVEILIGKPTVALNKSTLDTLRFNGIQRFRAAEEQGMGKRGAQRSTVCLRGSEFVTLSELEWTQKDQPTAVIYAASLALNDRPVLLQTVPGPGQSALCRTLLEDFVGGKLRGKKSVQPNWDAIQFANSFMLIPEGIVSDWQPFGDLPGLGLSKQGYGVALWAGQLKAESLSDVGEELRAGFLQFMEARGVEFDEQKLESGRREITPGDAAMGFGDPFPMEVPFMRYRTELHGKERVFSAVAAEAGRHVIAVMSNCLAADENSIDSVLRGIAERANADSNFRSELRRPINGSFPVQYDPAGWAVWSTGSGKQSEVKMYRAEGELKFRHKLMDEDEAKNPMPYSTSLGTMNYERSAMTANLAKVSRQMMGKRYIGGSLRDWIGFDYNLNGELRRKVGGVWFTEKDRYDYQADFLYNPYVKPFGQSDFWEILDQLEMDYVVGTQVTEVADTWHIPYGGAWWTTPAVVAIKDYNGFESGFAMAVTPQDGSDWELISHTFDFDADKGDEEVFAYLWENDVPQEWLKDSETGEIPAVQEAKLNVFGKELVGQRRIGRLKGQLPYMREHFIHRDGSVVRTWSLRGSTLALRSMQSILDQIRTSTSLSDGLVLGKLAADATEQDAGDGLMIKLKPSFGESSEESKGVKSWFDGEEFTQLQIASFDKRKNRISAALESIGTFAENPITELEKLKEICEPFLVRVNGRLFSANTFTLDGAPAVMSMITHDKAERVIMLIMAPDPKADLANVLAGWPALTEEE